MRKGVILMLNVFEIFVSDFSYCVPFTRFNIRGTTIGDRIMR
jgi:hypothetical protein